MRAIAVSIALLSIALVQCGGGGYRPDGPEDEPEPPIADGRGPGVRAPPPSPPPPPPEAPAETEAPPVQPGDAPEISRSVGPEGGAIVLWPRIVMPRGSSGPDETARAAAGRLQKHVAELTRHVMASRVVEVRPEPERVCPRSGCKAISVGVLIARAGKTGCSAVVTVTPPGANAATLVPWAGQIVLKSPTVPFRQHPETAVRFKDMAQCPTVLKAAAKNDEAVVRALRSVAGG